LLKTDSQLQTLQELVRVILSVLCGIDRMRRCVDASMRLWPALILLQVSSIEFTQIQATVMHGLEMGNDVLKQLHKEMSLERVERLMDQTREGVEYQQVSGASDLT
jgi:hypothetical protein